MTVKELIVALLDCDMDKKVVVEFPLVEEQDKTNYCRYAQSKVFSVKDYLWGVDIEVDNENQ